MTTVADKVPMWTPPDELNLTARMARIGYSADHIKWVEEQIAAVQSGNVSETAAYELAGLTPPTQLSFTATLGIAKRHRAACPSCRMRRVLFSIVATGNLFGGSEPRCSRCWGFA